MNGKGQVLMNSDVVPPDAQSVGIARFVRPGAAFALQSPLIAFVIESYRGHHLFLSVLVRLPAAHMMTARDDARFDSFGYPGAHDEITNLSFDAHQIAGSQAQVRGMAGMQPERIRVRNFIQPLRVRAARMNLNRQPESRDQNRLVRFEIVRVNMALDVRRNRVFTPAPIGERL